MSTSETDKETWESKRSRFLAGLPPETQEFKYRSRRSLTTQIDCLRQELDDGNTSVQYIIFTQVSYKAYNDIIHRIDSVSHCQMFYSGELSIIVLKVCYKNEPHACDEFDRYLRLPETLMRLILYDTWTCYGHTSMKEAERSWEPYYFPPGKYSSWPTVILETGLSKSYPRLKVEVEWLFEESRGEVQLVVLMVLDRDKREVAMEQWEFKASAESIIARAPFTDILAVPTLTNRVKMAKQSDDSVVVENGPMVLPFTSFYLRPPEIPLERDFVFPEDELINIANEFLRGL
ncbi:hypothetical protein FQN54_000433 [Arachnomyces sp. PD_36]|nr:hypothetical protein FQN54_000433 [Arachnomyces sp. PD_36]